MNKQQRESLKSKILKRQELYAIGHIKFGRLLKSPFRTFLFHILNLISKIRPFNITAKTLWGDKMTYSLPEGQTIFYYGFVEANLTNFLINFLKEGDTFIDIGAHVGFYSVLSSNLVGESGLVHSFEPTPRTFTSLKKNSERVNNIIINNNAILDHEKEMNFIDHGPRYSDYNSFKNRTSIKLGFLKKNCQNISVKTITFDSYCKLHNLKPDFIKIDTEGTEHLVLQGMNFVLSELKPVVSIEVAGDDEWKFNCHKSIEILKSKDYIVFNCDLNGLLSPHITQEKYSYDNLISIHKDKINYFSKLIK